MGRFITTLLSMLFILAAFADAQEFPSKWYFGKDFNGSIGDSWEKSGEIKATDYGDAVLKVVRADGSRF